MKIAVIGAGISGLSAAYFLSTEHEVTVFEASSMLGGHAHTATIDGVPVDTGFMVFNPPKYPLLTRLFSDLGVVTQETTMSFAISHANGFEYSSNLPQGLFADPHNIMRSDFYALLLEIHRFNTVSRKALTDGLRSRVTLKAFLTRNNFSDVFAENYIVPMVGSIWSTPAKLVKDFPALALLSFLENHRLLREVGQYTWSTVSGGSEKYVRRLERHLRDSGVIIRVGKRITTIDRRDGSVLVRSSGKAHVFDAAVCAVHADQALKLLSYPTKNERETLSVFQYERNRVVLHSDQSLMPKHRAAWAAWNYLGNPRGKVCLTYWMNELQHLPKGKDFFVTLNPTHAPKRSLVHERYTYLHPLYTLDTQAVRGKLKKLQGVAGVYFCGSYFGYGFHEDGIASALEVSKLLKVQNPWKK